MKRYVLFGAFLLIVAQAAPLSTKDASAQPPAELGVEAFKINVEEKRKEIVSLVKDAVDFFLKNRAEESFYAFLNDRKFTRGEVTLFVYDANGTIYVQETASELWKNLKGQKNRQGIDVFDLMMKKVAKGGGWVEYEWENGFKSSYIESVEKGGAKYIVGAGWYAETKENEVVSTVKDAVNYFKTRGKQEALREISNAVGQFVNGDIYVYAYDAKGYCVAHGDNVALIGRDFFHLRDDEGLFLIQMLIDKAKQGGGWVDYIWNHAPKRGYVELVSDADGDYIIGSGYHPDTKRSLVISLVKRGVKYFNSWGRERAAIEFNSQTGEFVIGDLAVFMYDFNGNVLSQGDYLAYVGQNLYNLRSSAGEYIVKNLIARADAGGGWIDYQWANDLASAYVEKVSDKEGSYLIGAAFYPDTKKEHVLQLVKTGVGYLKSHRKEEAMEAFAKRGGPFTKGSASLFVFNLDGDCLAYGENYSFIWKNFKTFKDVDGKQVFKLFVNRATAGGGWVEYKSKNITKLAYVEKVEKDNVPYIIGSAYYK